MVKLPCATYSRKCPGQREDRGLNRSLTACQFPAPHSLPRCFGNHLQGALEILRFTNIDQVTGWQGWRTGFLKPEPLGANPDFATYRLCDLGHIVQPLFNPRRLPPKDGDDTNSKNNNLSQSVLSGANVLIHRMHSEFYLAHRKHYINICVFKTHICMYTVLLPMYTYMKDVIVELKPSDVKTKNFLSFLHPSLFSPNWPNSIPHFLTPLLFQLFVCVSPSR